MKKNILHKMKEVSVEDHLKNACETRGGFALKMNANWYKGVPDRLCAIPGFMFFAELKRPKGGVVSPIQKWWQKRCEKLAIPHFIFSSKKEIDAFMAAHDKVSDPGGKKMTRTIEVCFTKDAPLSGKKRIILREYDIDMPCPEEDTSIEMDLEMAQRLVHALNACIKMFYKGNKVDETPITIA